MDHVAIMKKSWGLLPKILSGEKEIESRWYKSKRTPWGKIKMGDVVYFKNSGEPIVARARVKRVRNFENLNQKKVREILGKYGKADGIAKEEKKYFNLFKGKKYCILIFLSDPKKVKPFKIKKKGYGLRSTWIITEDINLLKK